MDCEKEVLHHYTDNGKTKIALIPQYAVPPGEYWSLDYVGVDLKTRSLLFIEVTESQTPSAKLIDKINRREEWIPVVMKNFIEETAVVDKSWDHLTIVFVIESRVEWFKDKINNKSKLEVVSLKKCYPSWLSGNEHERGTPRIGHPGLPNQAL